MTSAGVSVAALAGPAAAVTARHAPDVPVVEAAGRHDGPMIAPHPVEHPAVADPVAPVAAAHREGAP